jgi:hypothetical protein
MRVSMETEVVKEKLIEVLKSIQSDSGYESDSINESTCPLKDLEGFDSKVWPYAIEELATELGVEIPNNVNIYVSKDGKHHLTINESASKVCEIINNKRRK